MRRWRKIIGTLLLRTPLVFLGSFQFVRRSVGIDGNGHSLDLKGSSLGRRDVRRSACLRLRRGRPQVANRVKGLNRVAEKSIFQAIKRGCRI